MAHHGHDHLRDKIPLSDVGAPKIRQLFLRRNRLLRFFGVVLVVAATITASASFLILTGATPIQPDPSLWPFIWLANAVLIVLVIALLLTEGFLLVQARLSKQAGSGLHIRLVSMFAVAAAVPALIVAVVATLALNQGLDHWFSERTRAIVEGSRSVAASYLNEHGNTIRDDILGVATELEKLRDVYESNKASYTDILTSLAKARSLPFAYLLNEDQIIILKARINTAGAPPDLPDGLLDGVETGRVVVVEPGQRSNNLVGGVIKLTGYDNIYFFAARGVDPQVVEYMRLVQQNVTEYSQYESNRLVFQITFAFMYVGLAFVVLLAAVWLGIALANGLVTPIRNLMVASTRVSQGELNVSVPVDGSGGDLQDLSNRFNLMTAQLREQRRELVSANETIDQRRQFTEAVLEGVSAGIIGLDPEGVVTIANGTATKMLEIRDEKLIGSKVAEVVPELSQFVQKALSAKRGQSTRQIVVNSKLGEERIYQVKITREGTVQNSEGYVITLDDISDLIAAQRTSVWADVARRIAHEIKNPLTPIQLSAERLRRRYSEKLKDDFDVFEKCTDTIVRQVGDIGRMVDEFSSFARMPSANLAEANLAEIVRQSVFSEGVRRPDVSITTNIDETLKPFLFDERLISQVLINLIKNATEAMEKEELSSDINPKIDVKVSVLDDVVQVDVADNGKGWPEENRLRLLEPYMTTRGKGTGLGLAIVSKIIEQHEGQVELLDAQPDEKGHVGALFRFTLPYRQATQIETQSKEPTDK